LHGTSEEAWAAGYSRALSDEKRITDGSVESQITGGVASSGASSTQPPAAFQNKFIMKL